MSKHKRARRAPKACPNTSIHPNGRDTAKAGITTRPRRQRTVTEAHRRHVAEQRLQRIANDLNPPAR